VYRESLQDKAHELIECAGRPISHKEVVSGILGFPNIAGPVARRLANSLLRRDARFSYLAWQGWQLAAAPAPDAPLRSLTFTVVDTETTGSAPPCRVTEIGAVQVRGRRLGREFQSLVDSGAAIPSVISQRTGITQEMLNRAPTPGTVIPQFRRFLGRTVLVAHNLAFDSKFLRHEFRLQGLKSHEAPGLCTLQLARKLLRLRGNDLSQVAAHFRIEPASRHRALGDARTTANVFLRLLDILEGMGIKTLWDTLELTKGGR
jgi:DNA polymerase-3 subunit epsilon